MAGSICWYRERYRERMFPTSWKNQSLDSRSLASPNNQCKENHKHNPKLLRPHLTLARMAIITSTKDKILVKTWGKRCLQLLMSGVSTNATTMGISVGAPPNIKNRTTIWHHIPYTTCGHISKGLCTASEILAHQCVLWCLQGNEPSLDAYPQRNGY